MGKMEHHLQSYNDYCKTIMAIDISTHYPGINKTELVKRYERDDEPWWNNP